MSFWIWRVTTIALESARFSMIFKSVSRVPARTLYLKRRTILNSLSSTTNWNSSWRTSKIVVLLERCLLKIRAIAFRTPQDWGTPMRNTKNSLVMDSFKIQRSHWGRTRVSTSRTKKRHSRYKTLWVWIIKDRVLFRRMKENPKNNLLFNRALQYWT